MISDKKLLIYKLMILGYSISKISKICKIPQNKVKHYLNDIYIELGVNNRVQAFIKYLNDYN